MPDTSLIPQTTHDEQSLQDFVRDFRRYLKQDVMPGIRQVYENKVAPAHERENGKAFEDYHEVRRAMLANDYYQFWSAMQRRSQEMMWESVADPTERQLDELIERTLKIAAERPAGGSLELDPELPVPRYHTAHDIHLQPGAYHTELTDDDVAAGAIYEAGLPIYIDGELGPENDRIGMAMIKFFENNFERAAPKRILDMGCTVGNSTLPWAAAYPDAEVHAIDVAAPCLRYAHAKAELAGLPVHYAQKNAECTGYAAGSFDLVLSHIMIHETSKSALGNIVRESYRLLKPGGIMLHLDVPRGHDPFGQFMSQWEVYNNNEVFAAYLTDVDLTALAVEAGFDADKTRMDGAPPYTGINHAYNTHGFKWPTLVGIK
ncbi:MAG: class I SAM-dependent methyltransferase [Pseudomonadota bacterium]